MVSFIKLQYKSIDLLASSFPGIGKSIPNGSEFESKIATIGIGSSSSCDGQILVTDDMLGLSGFKPKFLKQYMNLNKIIEKGIQKYRREVINKKFPKNINSY